MRVESKIAHVKTKTVAIRMQPIRFTLIARALAEISPAGDFAATMARAGGVGRQVARSPRG